MFEEISFILIFAALYFVYILFKKYYLPKIKGARGEYYVARILKRLNKKDYSVYNDIYLEQNGKTTQIDHLIISIYGIFVIETKYYKGWIFANESSKYWTQTLYKKKYKIFNPVVQNWSHINFLKSISPDFKGLNYFSIIVFAGPATLKQVNSTVPVIYKKQLLKIIRKNRDVYLTHLQVERLDSLLKQMIITKKDIHKAHKRNVKGSIKRSKTNIRSQICPKCGGKLLIRAGKYGGFYGCSNYPYCRYTQKT